MKRLTEEILPKLKKILVELNLFKITTNDNNAERQVRYQRITTRIYIALLLISLIIMTFYLARTSKIDMKTIENPTISQFLSLKSNHSSSLQCSCSNISIPYNTFFTIKPQYHQMCSSDIISSSWLELHSIINLMQRDFIHVAYDINAGSLFVLLSTLCDYSQQTINISYQVFGKSMLVTAQVISEEQFRSETDEVINNWQKTTINNFRHTIQLIRSIYHGNHLAGAYANSFLDLSQRWHVFPSQLLLNSSFYYDQCNCMLSARCHSPMKAYDVTSSVAVYLFDIPGLYMGCSRLEALLSSTLECFYNQTCMDRIIDSVILSWYKGSELNFTVLNSSLNSANETIESVANRMFVDKWVQNISYNNYYMACAPSTCTYEYTRKPSLMTIITSVISIFGGLTSGLKILFIIFLYLLAKVRQLNHFF